MSAIQQALFMAAPASGVTYATWNPSDKGASVTLSNGDLTASSTTFSTGGGVRATIGKSSGKWYWEITVDDNTGAGMAGGIGKSASALGYPGNDANSWGYQGAGGNAGTIWNNNSILATPGTAYSNTNIIGHALDMTAGTCAIYKNNILVYTITSLSGTIFPMFGSANNAVEQVTANFGASALTYGGSFPTFNQGLF